MTNILPWASPDDFIASLDSVPWYSHGATDPRWKVYATEAEAKQTWLDEGPATTLYLAASSLRIKAEHKDYLGISTGLLLVNKMTWELIRLGRPEAGRDAQMIVNALYADDVEPALAEYALDSWAPWLAGYGLYERDGDTFYVYEERE